MSDKSYKFIYIVADSGVAIGNGWRLAIDSSDIFENMEIVDEVESRFISNYTRKTLDKELTGIQNPLNLGTARLKNATKHVFNRIGLWYNSVGGFMFASDKCKITKTIIKTDFAFPIEEPDIEEKITISRYSLCKHYYMSSSSGRMFTKEKYNSFESAKEEALRYVSANNIVQPVSKFVYVREGD